MALFAVCLPTLAAGPPSDPLAREVQPQGLARSQDGLPQNAIRVISQTPDGYLWIGSPGGLIRFDGSRFFSVFFDRANTPTFRDDSILALCPSGDGSLWIGLEGGGLLRYRNGSFRAFGATEGLTNGFVRALYEDPGGTLWVGTDRGFFRLSKDRLERLRRTRGHPHHRHVTAISQEHDGKIWAAAGIGLLQVEGGVVHRIQDERTALAGLRRLHVTASREVWLSTTEGLQRLDHGEFHSDPRLDHIRALSMCDDHEGNLWIGTLGAGLVRVSPLGVAFYRASRVLPDNTISAIFEDREQNLWVGTDDGLLRLNKSVVETLTSEDGLGDDNVSTIYEGAGGVLWMTTITGRVYRRAHGKLSLFQLPGSLANARVRTVFEDSRGAGVVARHRTGRHHPPGRRHRHALHHPRWPPQQQRPRIPRGPHGESVDRAGQRPEPMGWPPIP